MATYTVNVTYTNNSITQANITDQNVVNGSWINNLTTPVASSGGQTSGTLSGQQVEGSFTVKFLGGAKFIAKFKITMDGSVELSSTPPSANGVTMEMNHRIAGNTVSVNFNSVMG